MAKFELEFDLFKSMNTKYRIINVPCKILGGIEMKNIITIKVTEMQYNQIINGGSMLGCYHDKGLHLGDKLRIQLNECNDVFVYAHVIELVSKCLGVCLIKIKVPEIHVKQ